ncbi:MAG TPA: hypothetical protein VHF47_05995, partial [Acidimicrobiales bacterium]|nr:hypothetical protein [Acidimicrobiales bacterium]
VGEGHIGPRPAGAAQRRMLYGLLSVAGAAGNPDDEYGGGGPPLLDEALVGDNRMNGLAAGVLTIARLGRVVIEGNHVTGSHAGFLLLARHRTWPFGFSGAPGPSPHNSEHDIATLIFVVGDPVVLRTVLLSALLPLPTEPEDEPAEEARTASTSATATDDMRRSTARRLLDRLSGRHGDEVEVEVPVDEVEAVPVDEVEREAKSTARLSLHVADNVVDCRVVDGDSNAALLVIDDRYETYSTTTTDANRFDSSSNVMATTFLLLVDRGAITGNVVRNHGENGWSLAVVVDEDKRGERVAITGNSCDGNVFLPPRPMYPPPFHQWHVLNAITP